MSVCLVTGSAGLSGSEAVRWFVKKGMDVVGVDNDMRTAHRAPPKSTTLAADASATAPCRKPSRCAKS